MEGGANIESIYHGLPSKILCHFMQMNTGNPDTKVKQLVMSITQNTFELACGKTTVIHICMSKCFDI